jgi:O-antigen/teichoic acid export membrane protein
VISRYFKRRHTRLLTQLNNRVTYYMMMLGIPLAVGTSLLAYRIIWFVFKDRFLPYGAIALQILIWSELFLFVNAELGALLNSIDRQIKFTMATGAAAVVNIVLNSLLIPTYSYVGAGLATVATYFLVTLILQRYCEKAGYRVRLTSMAIKPLIASVVMGALASRLYSLHLLIILPICIAAYFLVLYMIKGFGKKELELFRMVIGEVKGKTG